MAGRRDTARAALQRSAGFLAPQHHDQILDALSSEGLLDEPKNAEKGGRVHAVADAPKGRPILTMAQAVQAKQENAPLVHQILATAARMNIDIDPTKVIDVPGLNRALAGRTVGERLQIKSMLARLHLIP